MWLYVSLYLVGVAAGVLTNIVFDVPLRRPGIRQAVGFVVFVLLLWGAISVTHTAFQDVLLPIVWCGTGLLAGFGTRGASHAHR